MSNKQLRLPNLEEIVSENQEYCFTGSIDTITKKSIKVIYEKWGDVWIDTVNKEIPQDHLKKHFEFKVKIRSYIGKDKCYKAKLVLCSYKPAETAESDGVVSVKSPILPHFILKSVMCYALETENKKWDICCFKRIEGKTAFENYHIKVPKDKVSMFEKGKEYFVLFTLGHSPYKIDTKGKVHRCLIDSREYEDEFGYINKTQVKETFILQLCLDVQEYIIKERAAIKAAKLEDVQKN